MTTKKLYGFTTITYTNTQETERLKQEEIAFVQDQDRQAEALLQLRSITFSVNS